MNAHEKAAASIKLELALGGYSHLSGGVPWRDRFAMLRRNYGIKQRKVDAELDSWFDSDVYEFADWDSLFTPIERSLWCDIRSAGISLWPQFPVGGFFVDFGNPACKVAVECDGRQFHQDKEKDAARDALLGQKGWTVYRVPGWLCHGVAPDYEPEMTADELEQRAEYIRTKTPATLIAEIKQAVEAV